MPWNETDKAIFLGSREGLEFIVVRGLRRAHDKLLEDLARLPRPCADCGAGVWSFIRRICSACACPAPLSGRPW